MTELREKINALRAYYGAGPTAMTDEQIAAGREVYGAKKHVDMVIVDELHEAFMRGKASLDDEFAEYTDEIAELTAERDEWKAKAEGLTEALEKLGCSVLANGTVFEPAPHVDAHSNAQSKTEPMLSEQSESLSDESDSREKLEEIAWEYDASYAEPYEHGAITEAIIEMFDRQAAITEREAQKRHELFCETCEHVTDEQLADFTAQLYELTAERDALADDLLTCNKEREEYRRKLSEVLDLIYKAYHVGSGAYD